MQVKLIAVTRYLEGDNTPEELIARSYGMCTGRDTIPVENIRKYASVHPSPVEHASVTFEISGISRTCSHQLVRHRIASYSQQSQRYVDESNPEWVLPPAIAEHPAAQLVWNDFIEGTRVAYQALRVLGMRKEDARFLLPGATATSIIVTMNFRELLHFFKVRMAKSAQWEIRELAGRMLELVRPYAPNVFDNVDIGE